MCRNDLSWARKVKFTCWLMVLGFIFSGCQTVPVVTYDVRGATTQDLIFDLRENPDGPKDSWGHRGAAMTHCEIQLEMKGSKKMRSVHQRCTCNASMTETSLNLKLEVTMPRWVEKAQTSSDCRKKWNQFLEATQEHEQGHVRICHDGFNKIKKAVAKAAKQVSEIKATDCKSACKIAWDSVSQKVKSAYRTEFNKLAQAQVDYDEKTRHGQTQGGVIRPCRK